MFSPARINRSYAAALLTSLWVGVCGGWWAVGGAVARSHRVSVGAVELTRSTSIFAATLASPSGAVAVHSHVAVAGIVVAPAVHVGTGWSARWNATALFADLELNVQLLSR